MIGLVLRWMIYSSIVSLLVIISTYSLGRAFPAPAMSFQVRMPDQSGDSAIHLYDWNNRRSLPLILNVRPEAYVWSPDGTKIVVSQLDEGITITVYDAMRGHPILPAKRGLFPAWSPDSTQLTFVRATAYGNETDSDVMVWTLATDTELNLTNSRDIDENLPFWSPDGESVIYRAQQANEAIQWQRISLGTSETTIDPLVTGAEVSPDGQWTARRIGNSARGQLQIFSRAGELQDEHDVETGNELIWSPDSRYVALAQPFPLGFRGFAGFPILVYDLHTNTVSSFLEDFQERLYVMGVAWTPDGRLTMLVIDEFTRARTWMMLDVATGEVEVRWLESSFLPSNIAWLPNG